MKRDQAYELLTKYLQNKNLIKHSLAAEVAMKALCVHLHPNTTPEEIEKWGITGLLHDVDYELAMKDGDMTKHGVMIFPLEPGIPEDIAHAIQAHNELTGVEPVSELDWGIRCADQLTGLIVACALIHPDKKLASIDSDFVLKRMKEKSFAKGAAREPILMCEEKLGIPLAEFVSIVLISMQGIHEQMGL